MSFSMMTHTTFQVPGHNPSPGHLEAALYVANYLSTTKKLGVYFTSTKRSMLSLFLHFLVLPKVLSMSDANWGPQ